MAIIKIKLTGHLAECTAVEPLATGSAGVDAVIIESQDAAWAGFEQTAVFKTTDGPLYATVRGNEAQIPAAVLLYERFCLAILGTQPDGRGGERRMTSSYMSFGIYPGADDGGTYPADPTETLYTEIREIAESAEEKAQSVVDRANAGDFDGEQGPQGPPGEVTEAELTAGLLGKADAIIVPTAGESVTIADGANYPFAQIRLFGKIIRADGDPTPDAPIPMDVDLATITVTNGTDTQTVVSTVLLGCKSNHADYTTYRDANNQRWYADEINVAQGVLIKRTAGLGIVGERSENWKVHSSGAFLLTYPDLPDVAQQTRAFAVSTSFKQTAASTASMADGTFKVATWSGGSGLYFYFRYDAITGGDDDERLANWRAWLAQHPQQVVWPIAEPETQPLDSEYLAPLRALHTYKGANTITGNNYIETEYRADTKLYIDGRIAAALNG